MLRSAVRAPICQIVPVSRVYEGGGVGVYFEARRGRNCIRPLNRLNAILSLLHPLDRHRTPSAIGSAIGGPLSRPFSQPNTGGSPRPPRSQPLWGAQPHDSGAIVSKTPWKQARNKNAIEAAILNRVLDRDWTLNRRGPLRVGVYRIWPCIFCWGN